MSDLINKPGHYLVTIDGKEFDCLAVIEALGLDQQHYLASAFAYLWRANKKGQRVADLKKAVFYLNREIKRAEDEVDGIVANLVAETVPDATISYKQLELLKAGTKKT